MLHKSLQTGQTGMGDNNTLQQFLLRTMRGGGRILILCYLKLTSPKCKKNWLPICVLINFANKSNLVFRFSHKHKLSFYQSVNMFTWDEDDTVLDIKLGHSKWTQWKTSLAVLLVPTIFTKQTTVFGKVKFCQDLKEIHRLTEIRR